MLLITQKSLETTKMQRQQFGQRGATINGEPVSRTGDLAASPPRNSAAVRGEPVPAMGIVAIVCAALVFLTWLEALVSGTSLITPINQTLLWGMRGAGLVIGFVGTLVAALAMTDTSWWRRVLTVLVLPCLIAFGFGELAYRISDWKEFGFSNQQFEAAQYPIDSIRWGRKGARNTIRIDPFETGDNTDIPISSDQYDDLRGASGDSCVTVMQRKSASGAIEIATNGRYMLSTPEAVQVTRCGFDGTAATPAATSTGNPWSK